MTPLDGGDTKFGEVALDRVGGNRYHHANIQANPIKSCDGYVEENDALL